jgi:hypothetical protein
MSAPQPASAAVVCQGLVIAIDSQSSTSTISRADDLEMPGQVVEVANDKQE